MSGKSSKAKKNSSSNTIALNKKARFDYHFEEKYEAGIALEGWEVKSLRAGRVQIKESYVIIRNGELFLFGAHITPLSTTSTHHVADPTRTRKLLLNRREISHLIGSVERQGYTLIPVAMYWKRGRAKLEIALAKGKKQHDKRSTIKEREWKRDQERMMKHARK